MGDKYEIFVVRKSDISIDDKYLDVINIEKELPINNEAKHSKQ